MNFADIALPNRWPGYRVSEGNHYIAQANRLLHSGDASGALHYFRVGLSKAPANTRGRTDLARLYLAYRRPDLAKETLVAGLWIVRNDPAYLRTALSFLLEMQEDAQLIEVTKPLLRGPPTQANATCRMIAATFAATAAYYRGDYEMTENVLGQNHLRNTSDGVSLLARIEWDQGFPELAILRLKDYLNHQPPSDQISAQLAGYYRSLGRTEEWASAAVERLVSSPLLPAPHIDYLYVHDQRGDEARLNQDTEAYLRQFQHDPAALLLLADFAANTGRPALALRVQQVAGPGNQKSGAFALMVAESCVAARQYDAALKLIADSARDFPEWSKQYASVLGGLQTVAFYGLGKKDDARLGLDNLLGQKNLRASNLVAVSNRLVDLGATDLALAAFGRAVEADPFNQAALTSLIRLELDTGSVAGLPVQLERFMKSRNPSADILARAYATIGSDRYLLFPAQAGLLKSLRAALAPRQG